MMESKTDQCSTASKLYYEAESNTNKDNLKYLFVVAISLLLCELLNEIGLFAVSPMVMRIGTAVGTVCFLIPVIVLWRPLMATPEPECKSWHKYFILAFAWLGTFTACITLTHHTVILMTLPIMLMAQYHETTRLIPVSVVLATICVLLGVYGGYFWGCFDGNLLHLGITEANSADLAMRVQMATPKRMLDLLPHYALPRELVVLSFILLSANISRRSNEMLKRQVQLQSAVELEMQKTNEIQWQIINGMANLIENRDASTGEHVKRTSFYVQQIVDALERNSSQGWRFTDDYAKTIVKAAPLHDIGKIVVADRILQKPGKLTPDEYEEIKLHAEEGVKVIENVLGNVEDDEFLHAAEEIAGGHHERWDGMGYPKGLRGEEIPLSARIMAVADVFDALISRRVYKEPMPPEDAFQIIKSEAGQQFDPEIVAAFCSLKPQILSYLQKNPASV